MGAFARIWACGGFVWGVCLARGVAAVIARRDGCVQRGSSGVGTRLADRSGSAGRGISVAPSAELCGAIRHTLSCWVSYVAGVIERVCASSLGVDALGRGVGLRLALLSACVEYGAIWRVVSTTFGGVGPHGDVGACGGALR